MAQPFSNPVYKARMKRILHDRANHFFKEEKKDDKNGKKPNINQDKNTEE